MARLKQFSAIFTMFVMIFILKLSTSTDTIAFGVAGKNDSPAPQALAAIEGGPGFVVISPLSFIPIDCGYADYLLQPLRYESNMIYNSGEYQCNFAAPVNLPHGATVLKIVLYGSDLGADNAIAISLMECPLLDRTCVSIAGGITSGFENTIRAFEFLSLSKVIDLQSFSYHVQVRLPAGLKYGITGVRIDYGYTTNLPLVQR